MERNYRAKFLIYSGIIFVKKNPASISLLVTNKLANNSCPPRAVCRKVAETNMASTNELTLAWWSPVLSDGDVKLRAKTGKCLHDLITFTLPQLKKGPVVLPGCCDKSNLPIFRRVEDQFFGVFWIIFIQYLANVTH